MEIAALGPDLKLCVDPVCGRNVDAQEAEISGRIASYANETFYFSSDECKKEFEKEPERYVRKEQPERKREDLAAVPEIKRTWADLLTRLKGGQGNEGGGPESKNGSNDSLGDSASKIIDWNGSDREEGPAPEWSRGWGGFPGAKYLGIKREEKTKSSEQPDGPPRP